MTDDRPPLPPEPEGPREDRDDARRDPERRRPAEPLPEQPSPFETERIERPAEPDPDATQIADLSELDALHADDAEPEAGPATEESPQHEEAADEAPALEPFDDEALPPLESFTFEPRPATEEIPDDATVVRVPAPAPAPPRRSRPLTLPKRRFTTLQVAAEALVPQGGSSIFGATEVAVAERVDAALSSLTPPQRRPVLRALKVLEWTTVPTRALRPFGRLRGAGSVAAMERALRSRLPLRRHAAEVVKNLCVNGWAATPRVEEAIGFTYGCVTAEPPSAGQPLEVIASSQITRDHVETCDAVVVGSGAGGAVIAKELAEAGLAVVILEEGASFGRNNFTGPPSERVRAMFRDQGLFATSGSPPVSVLMGRAVGGGTLVGEGTAERAPEAVLASWTAAGIDGVDASSLAPSYERVEKIQRARRLPLELLGPNGTAVGRGLERAGHAVEPVKRMIEGCRGCGVCTAGCPSDAKLSTHLTYLPRAQHHGATIFSGVRVERVLVEGGAARGVVGAIVDPKTGEAGATLRVDAPIVVLAAGAMHTPAILSASALANTSGLLGRGLHLQPSLMVAGFFPDEIHGWRGTQTPLAVTELRASHDLTLEVTAPVPSLHAASLPGAGLPLKEWLAHLPHMGLARATVTDTSRGRVMRGRNGRIHAFYRPNQHDTKRAARGVAILAESMLEARARAVLTGIPGVGAITSKAQLAEIKEEGIKARSLRLTSTHPGGTARMGWDPTTSVLDPWGEVHGVRALFVTDASMLPSPVGAQPQLTIMALATRTAEHIARERERYL